MEKKTKFSAGKKVVVFETATQCSGGVFYSLNWMKGVKVICARLTFYLWGIRVHRARGNLKV